MRGEQIKWGMIQPLTGGMYIGALQAIGHHAEFILSFPGLGSPKFDKKSNQITNCGNDYHLLKWLEKCKVNVPYYTFDRGMFDANMNNLNNYFDGLSFDGIDLVFAVPVCSGLSALTQAKSEVKDARNCNMVFITKYALEVIKPKVFVFENAPALVKDKGKGVRELLEQIASQYGYHVTYFKTNTLLHGIPQNRPRTFVMMSQHSFVPSESMFEHNVVSIEDYMKQIPENASQSDVHLKTLAIHRFLIEYMKCNHPDEFELAMSKDMTKHVYNNYYDDAIRWADSKPDIITDKEAYTGKQVLNHISECEAAGHGYWHTPLKSLKNDYFPALQSRSLYTLFDKDFNQLLSVREWLHLMGHPMDFELQGNVERTYCQVGQNVPVCTARWMANIAMNVIDYDKETDKIFLVNNIDEKIEELK